MNYNRIKNREKKIKKLALGAKYVKDSSYLFSEDEISGGKTMAVMSYIVPFLPYILEKKNKFVKFHAAQGMNLLMLFIFYSVVNVILSNFIKIKKVLYGSSVEYRITPWWVSLPLRIVGIFILALAVWGIVNAYNGKAKEIPLLGKFKIFK